MSRREFLWLGFLVLVGAGAFIAGVLLDANTESALLVEAAGNGQLEEVRRLIADGADVDARSDTNGGCTALYVAAGRGQPRVVALLLEHGADPRLACEDANNAWQSRGKTPLHVARDAEIAALLIEHGADVHARDGEGFTSIHRAIEVGKLEVVQYLVEQSAELPREWDRVEHAPMYLAVNAGNEELVRYLQEHDYDWKPIIGALEVAVAKSPEILPFLQAMGVDAETAAALAQESGVEEADP